MKRKGPQTVHISDPLARKLGQLIYVSFSITVLEKKEKK